MKKVIVLVLIALSTQGCATAYTGTGPDLSLRGEKARTEYARFHLKDSFWSQGWSFQMGPDEARHTLDSMQPVMAKVSQSANDEIETARGWRKANLLLAGAAIGSLAGAFLTDSGSSARNAWFTAEIVSGLSSIACGITGAVHLTRAADHFNTALETAFHF